MSSTDVSSQFLKITAADPNVLEDLTGTLDASGARPSKVRRAPHVPEQGLDPITIAITAYEVMIVLTKIGAAVQVVDWVVKKVRSFKSAKDAITITAGDKTITIVGAADIDELRRLLSIDAPPKTAT